MPDSPAAPPKPPAELNVTLTGLCRRFGRRTVFSDINAAAAKGEVLVIAGPNGSGKSTLLRIIAGLLSPSAGWADVALEGSKLGMVERRPYLGYTAPDLVLYPE